MNASIEVRIIHHDGAPAFAVLPMAQYESLLLRRGEKRATFPHDVVKLDVQQG